MGREFEWDPVKAEDNIRKHGIDFVDVLAVFDDLGAVDEPDDSMDYGEERYKITGLMIGRLLTVIYTERGEAIRIISARKATKHEERFYHSQQTPS